MQRHINPYNIIHIIVNRDNITATNKRCGSLLGHYGYRLKEVSIYRKKGFCEKRGSFKRTNKKTKTLVIIIRIIAILY